MAVLKFIIRSWEAYSNKQTKKWLLTKWQRQKGKKNDVLSILSYVFADDDPPCRACCVPFALLQVGESRSERGTEAQAQSFFFLIALLSSLS